jgi:short-subunit dehydrogenase
MLNKISPKKGYSVTAAGIGMHKPFFSHTWDDTLNVIQVNVGYTSHEFLSSRSMRN